MLNKFWPLDILNTGWVRQLYTIWRMLTDYSEEIIFDEKEYPRGRSNREKSAGKG